MDHCQRILNILGGTKRFVRASRIISSGIDSQTPFVCPPSPIVGTPCKMKKTREFLEFSAAYVLMNLKFLIYTVINQKNSPGVVLCPVLRFLCNDFDSLHFFLPWCNFLHAMWKWRFILLFINAAIKMHAKASKLTLCCFMLHLTMHFSGVNGVDDLAGC